MSEAAVLQSVVVLDDNAAFCAMVQEILEGEGYRVASCTDPGAALDTVIELQPDLVISDWWLRDAEGERLAYVIRRDARTAHVPLLVCTADGMIHNEIEVLAVDGIEVIRKPFNLSDFIAAVGRKLEATLAPSDDKRRKGIDTPADAATEPCPTVENLAGETS